MHELGIVFSIIRDVEDVARENEIDRVQSVRLRVGEVSTVIPYYLEDCWNWAVDRTEILKGAALHIDLVPAVTFCGACRKTYPTVQYGKTCPHCGSGDTWLQQGDECVIQEIEVRE